MKQSKYSFGKKRVNSLFIIFMCLVSTFVSLFAINYVDLNNQLSAPEHMNYPKEYSTYHDLSVNNHMNETEHVFGGLEYTTVFKQTIYDANIVSSDRVIINVYGVKADYLNFPISTYYNSLAFTKLNYGEQFTNIDIVTKSNSMMMFESDLAKLNFKTGDQINILGTYFSLKGVLNTTNDLKRLELKNETISIFIPYTSLLELVSNDVQSVFSIIKTDNYKFPQLADSVKFYNYEKVLENREFRIDDFSSMSNILVGTTIGLSIVAIVILQLILVKNRHLEIGIRRVVGASKLSIVSSFTFDAAKKITIGITIGFVVFVIAFFLYALVISKQYYFNLLSINIKNTIIFILAYFNICILSILIPTIIGSNINISSILTEER